MATPQGRFAVTVRNERVDAGGLTCAAAGDGCGTLLAIARGIADLSCSPGFRGCPFINAAAEYGDPEHPDGKLEAGWFVFDAGDDRIEDVWRWFDERYPGGVAALMGLCA